MSYRLGDQEVILIDNFDSFTYNLVNLLERLVNKVTVYRNNHSIEKIEQLEFTSYKNKIIVVSPGPGSPNEAGISLALIEKFKGKIPILGICLGHQAIVQVFGGIVSSANQILHGKASDIQINTCNDSIFFNVTNPFKAARYHSLAAKKLPKSLQVIATCEEEIMAVKHIKDKILGFQFHPESILTPLGTQLMENALKWLSSSAVSEGANTDKTFNKDDN